MKIKINILFWNNDKDKQRLDNTNLSWFYLKKFTDAANEAGLEIEPFLFDFSEDKVLDDAIHISYPKGVYKRSEKINKVIEYHKSDEEYIFSVMDSDLIIKPKDYNDLIYLLKSIKDNKFYVFHLDDLINLIGVDFENKIIYFEKIQVQQRPMNPDLGALFFIKNSMIQEVGGFDESFTVYGGEDNKISNDLQNKGYKKVIWPIKPIHLYHENLLNSVINTEQYQKQYKIVMDSFKKKL